MFQGFYGVYRKVFESIAAEDLEFMQDMKSNFEIPGFGKSTSNYDEVSEKNILFSNNNQA